MLSHVSDAPRSGRPSKQQNDKDEVIELIRDDPKVRELNCEAIAQAIPHLDVSAQTVWRILKAARFRKKKPTTKPGLSEASKKTRLEFCLQHQHWSLEDWKNVIWTDETAVVLGVRRLGHRIWRTPEERLSRGCFRPRWKRYTEFMFWGSFSYDRKGPCHIWKPETAQERKIAERQLNAMNAELEPILREEWELNMEMARLGLRGQRGKKPQWKWDKKHGKLVRESKGGIDWWRYQYHILLPKPIPFAKECKSQRPHNIVQEDNAPSHNHHAQQVLWEAAGFEHMFWPPNLPDLNMIEPSWTHLKRVVTKRGAPTRRADMKKAWQRAWDNLDQSQIQAWIERIPVHIQKVIELEGGNLYKEGRNG